MVLLVGRMGQFSLSSKRLPDIFLASGQGVLAHTGAFSNGGGLFSDVEGFWLSEFTGALAFVWGGCTASLLGSSLATTFTLCFFAGISFFYFLCCFGLFSYLGIRVRLKRSKLIGLGLGFWSQLAFQLEVGLHFLDDGGMGAESSPPWITFNKLTCPVPSKCMGPLH